MPLGVVPRFHQAACYDACRSVPIPDSIQYLPSYSNAHFRVLYYEQWDKRCPRGQEGRNKKLAFKMTTVNVRLRLTLLPPPVARLPHRPYILFTRVADPVSSQR